jgi:thioredoxin 1
MRQYFKFKEQKMKKLMTLVVFFCTTLLMANEPMLQETPFAQVATHIGQGKPYFLEIGSDSCHSCQKMGRLLYKVKQQHPEYNIAFINVKKEREVAYRLGIRMIPTQIIYDRDGREIFRHIGLLAADELMQLLKTQME